MTSVRLSAPTGHSLATLLAATLTSGAWGCEALFPLDGLGPPADGGSTSEDARQDSRDADDAIARNDAVGRSDAPSAHDALAGGDAKADARGDAMITGDASSLEDPYFSSVVLLMHMDGANGSTTFTDVIGHTVTPNGKVSITTTTSKFGGSSASFDGTSAYLSIPYSSNVKATASTLQLEE